MSRAPKNTNADAAISNLVRIGIVEEVATDNPPRARVRCGDFVTGWMRMGTSRAGDAHQSWPYSVGEEVVFVAMDGDLRHGAIICALPNAGNPSHAVAGVFKAVFPGGVVVEINGGAVHITAPGNVIVNGDVIAGGVSLKTHVHVGVIAGPATTGGPR